MTELKKFSPRYLAIVAKPEEIDRVLVNKLHRITRQLDDDPYGDCIWGIITGSTATIAERMADTSPQPLVLKRGLGTTNFDHNRFEKSFMITDWGPNEYWQQTDHGKTDGKKTREENPEGMAFLFNEKWQEINPQMIISSSHATQYNLEMPFSKGLIASMNGRFHILRQDQLREFAQFLRGVTFEGSEKDLKNFIEKSNAPQMPLSEEPKVWIAAGNCLFGDARNSSNSMVVTAIGSANCKQVIGYTVPTWYGKGGWGTLGQFFDNTAGIPLAQAWYLNNQLILHNTLNSYPELMDVAFNGTQMSPKEEINKPMFEAFAKHGYNFSNNRDALGLVHDRDVVAFYGNPKFIVTLDTDVESKSPWLCAKSFTASSPKEEELVITASKDFKGPFTFFHPKRLKKTTNSLYLEIKGQLTPIKEVGVETNDFIIVRELDLKKGDTVRLLRKAA